jgi:type IV pilus assembly protein PilA
LKNNNIKFKKNSGFTLIELMVVITIILVMLGFLVPKLYGYQVKAKQTKAINTAKQIQTAAMSSYSEDNQKFVENDVISTIGNLTGVDTTSTPPTTIVTPGTTDQDITVKFDSDGDNYTVGIDAANSSYTVNAVNDAGSTQIYPKVIDDTSAQASD